MFGRNKAQEKKDYLEFNFNEKGLLEVNISWDKHKDKITQLLNSLTAGKLNKQIESAITKTGERLSKKDDVKGLSEAMMTPEAKKKKLNRPVILPSEVSKKYLNTMKGD